eukprot:Gb_27582 [translate_table: standard]
MQNPWKTICTYRAISKFPLESTVIFFTYYYLGLDTTLGEFTEFV